MTSARACAVFAFLLGVACGSDDAETVPDGGLFDAIVTDAPASNDGGEAACPFSTDAGIEPSFRVLNAIPPIGICAEEEIPYDHGTMDVALTSNYFVTLRVMNELDDTVATHTAWAVLDLGDHCEPIGGNAIEHVHFLAGQTEDTFDFFAIPAAIGVALEPAHIALSLALEGDAVGRPIITPTFTLPVEVCDGCLQNNLGPCESVEPPFQVPCLPGHNEPIDCCTTAEGPLRCPP